MRLLLYCFLSVFLVSCSHAVFREKWTKEKAPENFSAGFETSKGYFEVLFTREWSPLAVDRLYAQIRHHYYDHTLFYRVRAGYVAQFGVADSAKMKHWRKYKVPDEPVVKPNTRGSMSFARDVKDSRGNDLFINLRNNSPRLDTILSNGIKGYPVVGTVTTGMNVIDSLCNEYGDAIFRMYNTMLKNKQVFLDSFPKLDSIRYVRIVKK